MVTKARIETCTFEQRVYLDVLKYIGLTNPQILKSMPPDSRKTVDYFFSSECNLLTETKKFVMRKYYQDGMTMGEISEKYQLTPKTVRSAIDSGTSQLVSKSDIFLSGITKYMEEHNGSKP